MYHLEQWGTVCDDHFDTNDATVLCKTGGFKSGAYVRSVGTEDLQILDGIIWLINMHCQGTEEHINECGKTWLENSAGCNHYEDVVVRCVV